MTLEYEPTASTTSGALPELLAMIFFARPPKSPTAGTGNDRSPITTSNPAAFTEADSESNAAAPESVFSVSSATVFPCAWPPIAFASTSPHAPLVTESPGGIRQPLKPKPSLVWQNCDESAHPKYGTLAGDEIRRARAPA